ncbi:MAG: ESX secretion-associated protein EspG [Actinomycetota bacterium]|nr:ESX secretion-associated protein EspG [Actinomycetota bacterium]
MTTASPIDRTRDGLPERRVLTAVEFDVLWEWLGLGATPVVLRLSSPGRTQDERRRVVASGWQGLRDRGIADVGGPDPNIVRLMHLLATPSEQVELRMQLGRELRVLTAGRSGASALAVRQDETVTLSSTTDPVAAVLGVLPRAPAGPGGTVAVPSSDLEYATGRTAGGRSIAEALMARNVPECDALVLDGVLRAGTRRGQLSMLAADSWGVLRRHHKVLGLVDTPKGRYLMHREPSDNGMGWTTLAPVDPPRLTHRARRLLTEAHTRAARH